MDVKRMVKVAMVAAIYWALTVFLEPISYGAFQCRVSEFLLLLCFFRPEYAISLVLGCFLANMNGPFGLLDMIFGTLHSVVSVALIVWVSKWKGTQSASRLWIASLGALVGTPLIGYMLYIADGAPFIATTLWVALGEFVAVTILGVPLFKLLGERIKKII